jgi:hypothetical protein
MKTISYARLEEYFPNADLELEGHLNGRFADVLLTFPEPRSPYGKGIAVEVQYRNKGKDIEAVTEHYFQHSYSVAWLEKEDFMAHDVDLSGILTLWPNALPDRRGMVGYSDVIQSLWKESNPPVEREIPIPGEYWASSNQSDDWILISEERLKHRAELQLLKYSTDSIIFGLGKGTRSGMEEVKVEASKQDVAKIRRFADELDDVAFGDNRPPAEECDPEWHDLAQVWLTGSSTVKTWMKATLPNPDSSVVLQLWKKNNDNTKHVGIQINYSAVDRLHDIADTLERVFEIENGERELFISDDSRGDPGCSHN